ncbi:MAG: NifB/NifX family molybdenum-iron cluster-binding protein [Candidatus Omnitrophica bacterium]|nr:NifB/NifX family molybdenum-iron cluster-binding protein [Candidatus Omnitrophota bacterium]
MRVIVTAQGPDLSSQVDPRLGRAKFYLVVDTETGSVVAHDNSKNLNAAHGAGIQAGKDIVELGAEAVITGQAGPKASAVLSSAGVKICTGAQGTVSDALDQFKKGGLCEDLS